MNEQVIHVPAGSSVTLVWDAPVPTATPARAATPATPAREAKPARVTKKNVLSTYYAVKAATPKSLRPALREALGFTRVQDGTRMETATEWVTRVGVRPAAESLVAVGV